MRFGFFLLMISNCILLSDNLCLLEVLQYEKCDSSGSHFFCLYSARCFGIEQFFLCRIDGIDGVDGIDGIDGIDGNLS